MDDEDEGCDSVHDNYAIMENGVWYAFKCPVCLVEQSAWWLHQRLEGGFKKPFDYGCRCEKCHAELTFTVHRHTNVVCVVEKAKK